VVTTAQRWRIALWLTMLTGILYVAYGARGALLPFALGALLAYAMAPLVDRLAAVIPARSHRGDVYRRGAAVFLLYLTIGSAGFLVGSAVVPVAVDQVSEFVDTLPETVDAAREQTNTWLEEYRDRVPADVQDRVDTGLEDAGAAAVDAATSMVQHSIGVLTGTLGLVIGFAVMPFWMFYAMRDQHFVRRNFLDTFPESLRDDAINLLHIGDRLLGRYIRAQLILGVIVGTSVGIGLALLDVPLSLALGVIAGMTELIPILGPWLGAVPGLLLVAATEPDKIVWVALVYLLVQQAENLLLVPRIQGEALEMHPAMILLVLSLGGAAFGLIGLLVAVPLSALLREVFWYLDRRLKGDPPEVALEASHVGQLSDVFDQLSHEDQMRAAITDPVVELDPSEAVEPIVEAPMTTEADEAMPAGEESGEEADAEPRVVAP
jgi:predicted PurR-regulated permease PerM